MDQHNSNIPAIGNTIAADIPDIKENLEFHKDAFQRIFATWSDTDNSSSVFSTTPGFNNGTYAITFPTNGMAASKFMLGNSNTIIWMYLNTAPPGWKALSTGADMVLAVAGGSGAYNVNGGNPDSVATWTISGLVLNDHTHIIATHTHTGTTNTGANWSAGTVAGVSGDTADTQHDHAFTTAGSGELTSGAASTSVVSSSGAWRPKASVGKLFQLDTA